MQQKDLPLIGHLRIIDGALFVRYDIVMELEGLSKHFHHLERRKAKYPQHIKEQDGIPYMSMELAETLHQYHIQSQVLETLQQRKPF